MLKQPSILLSESSHYYGILSNLTLIQPSLLEHSRSLTIPMEWIRT